MKRLSEDTDFMLPDNLKDCHRLIVELRRDAKQYSSTKQLQKALFRIVDIANSTHNIDAFYKELHNIVSELTSAKNFFIAIYHSEINCVSFPYYEDDEDDQQGDDDPLHNKDKMVPIEDIQHSATAKVILEGKLLHLDQADILKTSAVGRPAHNWIGVPLVQDHLTLGALVVQSYEKDFRYEQRDVELLTYVSQHIATALRRKQDSEVLKIVHQQLKDANLKLEQRVADRTKELKDINSQLEVENQEKRSSEKIQHALYKITDLVSTSKSLDSLFAGVHETISTLMYAENIFIALVRDDRTFIEFPYFVDQMESRPEAYSLDLEDVENSPSLTIGVLKTGKPALLSNYELVDKEILGPRPISWLGVPLLDNSSTFGVLVVQSYDADHVHTPINLTVMMSIAKQISTAILRKKDADALVQAHENLERRVKERTSILEETIVNRKKIEEQLEYESLHDSLTQLPNRRFLSEQLNFVLNNKPTSQACDIALLFLDLDRFKVINDSLGHRVGDLFLVEVSKRLLSCMRNDDIVVRLGGDEFCILMLQVNTESEAIGLADRILKQLQVPVEVEQHSLITSASIGIRLAKIGVDDSDQIIGEADSAMYQAKNNGKNRFCLFDANIKLIVSQRLQLEQDLRKAIGTPQIVLHYQPIIDLYDNSIVGVEALLRWKHSERGFISPMEFIPIAEETGIIQELGESVVEMSCQTLSLFSNDLILKNLYLNFNISPIQILSRTFDIFIRKQVEAYNINPSLLNGEITESILVEDFSAATHFVKELKSIGMKVILDDFGTGYSSLSYLHQFPFDLIKLDRSFIQSTKNNDSNITLIESIRFLASNLGMQIVVEGIETESQLVLAQNLDCRYGQGFYFAKPMPIEEIVLFVRQ